MWCPKDEVLETSQGYGASLEILEIIEISDLRSELLELESRIFRVLLGATGYFMVMFSFITVAFEGPMTVY